MEELRIGRYRHYKGQTYLVLGVARHSETFEEFVVYQAEYGDKSIWIRPIAMFIEQITLNGQQMPRFKFVDE
jgi:hypothetical protein